ncbi:putative N-acetyltransferase YhbS [Halomonas ventosae]|uniref:Putative N-acetyltransferase YhbS n=1 Tax=Halomonas ventosae TaxID=229007 RepID=A0A4R6ZL84_9GAMM|nr:N-acetyltransferase [Halomonas ventosae]TDR53012.1 putative N-acetyltransferase YhbS [Halomonas ventosae]
MQLARFAAHQAAEVQALFARTFSDAEGPAEGERVGGLVRKLVADTDPRDVLGFVAMEKGRAVAGIFFSRLRFDTPVEAFLLSPVAVHPDYQGQGIGQRLIRFGLERLKERGVTRVFTYGAPAFYSRVGFTPVSEETAPFRLSQPEGWLGQALDGHEMTFLPGVPRCVTAFDNPAYW